MKRIAFGTSACQVPVIGIGCMRMKNMEVWQAAQVIDAALEQQVNFFDHADIYGEGAAEELFAKALEEVSAKREDVFLQSKCGIIRGVMLDLSKEHIIRSVDGCLKRLKTDYLDALLLHRPDALMEPEEIAEAFDLLETSGKVRYFGVSNQNSMQMELLRQYVKQPLMVDQLQFGLGHAGMVQAGLETNMLTPGGIVRDGSVLDYSRLQHITIQTWSPFQYGRFEGNIFDTEKFPELNQKLQELAEKYEITKAAVAAAWILRHPAKMQVLSGTMNPGRLVELCQAADIELTRREWYELYLAAGNFLP